MGSPQDEFCRGRYDEEQRDVTFTHDLLFDQYETTQADWMNAGFRNVAGTQVNDVGGRDCTESTCPAAMLTWMEAVQYANNRSIAERLQECIELTGCSGTVGIDFTCSGYRQTTASLYDCTGYRLPTMPEFQYASRAGTKTTFYSGPFSPAGEGCVHLPHLDSTVWYCQNSGNRTHAVGTLTPNAFGLYDMVGNAAELTASQPDRDTRDKSAIVDPNAVVASDGHLGGISGFYFSGPCEMRPASQAFQVNVLSTDRFGSSGPGLGFRLVRSISRAAAAAW